MNHLPSISITLIPLAGKGGDPTGTGRGGESGFEGANLVGSKATLTARRIPIFHGFLGTAIFKSSVFYPAPQDAASMLANNGPCPSEGTSTEPIG